MARSEFTKAAQHLVQITFHPTASLIPKASSSTTSPIRSVSSISAQNIWGQNSPLSKSRTSPNPFSFSQSSPLFQRRHLAATSSTPAYDDYEKVPAAEQPHWCLIAIRPKRAEVAPPSLSREKVQAGLQQARDLAQAIRQSKAENQENQVAELKTKLRATHRLIGLPYSTGVILNRGVYANQASEALRQLGMRVIIFHTEADRDTKAVRDADEAILIPSYTDQQAILKALSTLEEPREDLLTLVGYGFLSENADFAEAQREAGFASTAASPEAQRIGGMKDEFRRFIDTVYEELSAEEKQALQENPNGPWIDPETYDPIQAPSEMKDEAYDHFLYDIIQKEFSGQTVVLKAPDAGGGGGIAVIRPNDSLSTFQEKMEKKIRAFGYTKVIIEAFLEDLTHEELQGLVLADGTILDLGGRNCTVQRGFKKWLERALIPKEIQQLSPQRAFFQKCLQKLHIEKGFVGYATGEFGFNTLSRNQSKIYEFNLRRQVEIVVTGEQIGINMDELQLLVHLGVPFENLDLYLTHKEPSSDTIEARIYAQDPTQTIPGTTVLSPTRFTTKAVAPHSFPISGITIDTLFDQEEKTDVDGGTADPMIAIMTGSRDKIQQALHSFDSFYGTQSTSAFTAQLISLAYDPSTSTTLLDEVQWPYIDYKVHLQRQTQHPKWKLLDIQRTWGLSFPNLVDMALSLLPPHNQKTYLQEIKGVPIETPEQAQLTPQDYQTIKKSLFVTKSQIPQPSNLFETPLNNLLNQLYSLDWSLYQTSNPEKNLAHAHSHAWQAAKTFHPDHQEQFLETMAGMTFPRDPLSEAEWAETDPLAQEFRSLLHSFPQNNEGRELTQNALKQIQDFFTKHQDQLLLR